MAAVIPKPLVLCLAMLAGLAWSGPSFPPSTAAAAESGKVTRRRLLNRPQAPLRADLPPAWSVEGSNKREYEGGTDLTVLRDGKPSGYIRSVGLNLKGVGTLVTEVPAEPYRGKTIRITAQVKSEKVQQWAGLWAGLDSESQPFQVVRGGSERFKVQPRAQALIGSVDWRPASIEIAVPADTDTLLLGLVVAGRGTAYINRVRIDEVQPRVLPSPDLDFGGGISR